MRPSELDLRRSLGASTSSLSDVSFELYAKAGAQLHRTWADCEVSTCIQVRTVLLLPFFQFLVVRGCWRAALGWSLPISVIIVSAQDKTVGAVLPNFPADWQLLLLNLRPVTVQPDSSWGASRAALSQTLVDVGNGVSSLPVETFS